MKGEYIAPVSASSSIGRFFGAAPTKKESFTPPPSSNLAPPTACQHAQSPSVVSKQTGSEKALGSCTTVAPEKLGPALKDADGASKRDLCATSPPSAPIPPHVQPELSDAAKGVKRSWQGKPTSAPVADETSSPGKQGSDETDQEDAAAAKHFKEQVQRFPEAGRDEIDAWPHVVECMLSEMLNGSSGLTKNESSIRKYVSAVNSIFQQHRRSFKAMASSEYRTMLRAAQKAMTNLQTGLIRFEAFFLANVERNGGSYDFPLGWWQRLGPIPGADVTPIKQHKSHPIQNSSTEEVEQESPPERKEHEKPSRCRISNDPNTSQSALPVEDEGDIRRQIQQLPAATAEEEAAFPRLVGGFRLFLTKENDGPSNTEATARSYICAFQALYMRDKRSFQALASDEYLELIKKQFKGKQTHSRACLFKFAEFYKSHAAKNGGEFEVDPTWEEERIRGVVETEKPLPWHGSLNRFFGVNSSDQGFPDGGKIKTDPPLNGPLSGLSLSATGQLDDGQVETPEKAKRCRLNAPTPEENQKASIALQHEIASPDDDQDRLRKVLELPAASDEQRASWPKLLSGMKVHMMTPGEDGVANTEGTAMTYIGAIKTLFSRHGKSFETMASDEYGTLVRGFKKSKTNHFNSCLAKFRAFYTAICQKNGGRFQIDPDWPEMPNCTNKEYLTDSHGELRDPSRVQEGGSKYVGVFWHGCTRRWIAVDKSRYIGIFATPELAAEARWRWKHPPKQAAGKNLGHFFRVCLPGQQRTQIRRCSGAQKHVRQTNW